MGEGEKLFQLFLLQELARGGAGQGGARGGGDEADRGAAADAHLQHRAGGGRLGLVAAADGDRDLASFGVVCVDEVDKLRSRSEGNGEVGKLDVQSSLAKGHT